MANISGSSAITIEELKKVLQSLKEQKDIINKTYNERIVTVINNSASCLSVAGLDYSKIEASYKDTFTKINNNFENLINLLENDVIKNYSELAMAIKQMFNVDFANKMESLLNLK